MATTYTLPRGTSADFPVQINNRADGTPAAGFLGSDAIAVKVWAGQDTAAVVTPAATWIDAPSGTFRVSFDNADTAGVGLGSYRMVATVTRGSRTAPVADLVLRVTASPGTAPVGLAFTTWQDLTNYAPWLGDLQTESDETAFAGQQARATTRLIDLLVESYRPGGGGATLGQPGFMAGVTGGGDSPNYWLRQQLVPLRPGGPVPSDLTYRTNTTPNLGLPSVSTALLLWDDVREVCAKLAVSMVLDAQVGRGAKDDWAPVAAKFRADALGLFRSRRFEVDLSVPQTGFGFPISGGHSSVR